MATLASTSGAPLSRWRSRVLLYEDEYIWLAILSALDVTLNWVILNSGGRIFNPIVDSFIQTGGFGAMLVFKLLLVSLLVLICEDVGRARPTTGHRIATLACAVAALPVALAIVGLLAR